ncbi:MAG: hypothetical protein RL238_3631 [Actinomycetota bacterium]|jgi:hypothetical protein
MITNSSFDRSEPEILDDETEVAEREVTFLQRRRRPVVYAAPAVVSLWGDRFVASLSGTDMARMHTA